MLIAGQFRVNNNVNRITEKAPFDLILRFRPKMRMNIEITKIENNYNVLKETPAARREIKLKKKRYESRAKYMRHIVNNREEIL
jgi:hypothetical protein